MTNQYDHIRNISEGFTPTPPPRIWNTIEDRLSNVKSKSKRNRLHFIKFWVSIAASLMIIATCSYFIYQESVNPQAYQVEYIAELEDLKTRSDYFYSVENARIMRNIFISE